jgi:RNA polymerase sigma factor (TIGR02999 family)
VRRRLKSDHPGPDATARCYSSAQEIVEADITRLLIEWRHGHEAARDALLPLVYDELRRIASRQMSRERDGHTLQPTALVHEAWMRLASAELDLKDRAHFLAIAARVMRQVLVQHARGVNAEKRGAGIPRVELKDDLDVADASASQFDCDLLALDDALVKLAAHDERKNHIVELKYFGGLTDKEISEALGVAVITVRRDLKVAHAFLHWQITGAGI